MNSIFLKDMAYRRARVVLTAIGITVLIALILMLGGIMNGMRIQAGQYVQSTGADIWISAEGSGSAFIGFSLLNPEYLGYLNMSPELEPNSVSPLVFAQARPVIRGKHGKAVMVGYKIGKLGGPTKYELTEGRLFASSELEEWAEADLPPREVVIDEKMNLQIGERILIGSRELKVVGKVKSLMFVLDTPLLFMDIRTAQDVLLKNTLHVNMMIARTAKGHTAEQVMQNLERTDEQFKTIDVRTLEQTLDDIIDTYVDEPMKAVQFLRVMLWLAAGLIVSMITYVTTLEKTQEIGVLKAIGASNFYVTSLILKQVALTSAIGVISGVILSYIFAAAAPIFVSIHLVESVIVAVISFIVCCGGGYLAARKAIAVDPMVAFRGEI
ncbi:MAG: ABC transporter permease [Candidatus Poribacteria bacterium]|nr:ABC transporter permease [Candidatus Poribacteria bacterium]